jgi:hypothetical protein
MLDHLNHVARVAKFNPAATKHAMGEAEGANAKLPVPITGTRQCNAVGGSRYAIR